MQRATQKNVVAPNATQPVTANNRSCLTLSLRPHVRHGVHYRSCAVPAVDRPDQLGRPRRIDSPLRFVVATVGTLGEKRRGGVARGVEGEFTPGGCRCRRSIHKCWNIRGMPRLNPPQLSGSQR